MNPKVDEYLSNIGDWQNEIVIRKVSLKLYPKKK